MSGALSAGTVAFNAARVPYANPGCDILGTAKLVEKQSNAELAALATHAAVAARTIKRVERKTSGAERCRL